jgi:hypothetical protein
MGKEMQVSLGVIGVLLMLFLAMVFQRLFWDPSRTDQLPSVNIPSDQSDSPSLGVHVQPTIVGDDRHTDSVDNPRQPAENPRNPRKSRDDSVQPSSSRNNNDSFRPIRMLSPAFLSRRR